MSAGWFQPDATRQRRTSFRPRVEALESRLLLSIYQVTNTQDAGPGSLRRAILDADAHAGHDRIAFAIPGDGVHTIALASALPTITQPVILDGTTQPGFAGSPLIELDGRGAGANAAGLRITAGNSTVRGLAIDGFGRSGIELMGKGGNVVVGNDIGTSAAGDTALGNAVAGIAIGPGSDNNLIGGNLIAGNGGDGVFIAGSSNVVQGNFLGTDVTGMTALPNRNGVFVDYTGGGNTIGGTAVGSGNLIAGNRASGVLLNATPGNVVQGNFLGTDISGTVALGNGANGVFVTGGWDNTVGGTAPGAGNLISGNGADGVVLRGGRTLVQGNFLGTDVTGMTALPNRNGIATSDLGDNTIGETMPGAGNLISGNREDGIAVSGNGLIGDRVQGNYIGTDRTGAGALGNGGDGVFLRGQWNNAVGGTAAGAGNVIAFNGGDGVKIRDPLNNPVLENSITANGRLGIELLLGGNNEEPFPVLTAAVSNQGTVTISGTLSSVPDTVFRLEFFSNRACDPSGFGEGESWVGAGEVATDDNGTADFSVTFPVDVAPGWFLAATATDSSGNTSPFSRCQAVTGPGPGGASSDTALSPRLHLLSPGTVPRLIRPAGLSGIPKALGAGSGPRETLAGTYYVSPLGKDTNDGSSPMDDGQGHGPWRTLSQVNQNAFPPGSTILLQGGATADGNLFFADGGTADAPITVGSYGSGRATLAAGPAGAGILVADSAGFHVTRLNLTGVTEPFLFDGIDFFDGLDAGQTLPYVALDHLGVQGFGGYGTLVNGMTYGRSGYADVRITDVDTHDNISGGLGVFDWSSWPRGSALPTFVTGLTIAHVEAHDNPGFAGRAIGPGIRVQGINGGIVEWCRMYRNATAGGTPDEGGSWGFEAYDADRLVIQDNESFDNRSITDGDGGGFDIDQGVTNSVLQYNFSHGNNGPGFAAAGFLYNTTHDDVLRYNISDDDVRRDTVLGSIFIYSDALGAVYNLEIYNNDVYLDPGMGGVAVLTLAIEAVHFRNNIFQTTGGTPVIEASPAPADVAFQGNDYWSDALAILWGDTTYTDLDSWRQATHQETLGADDTGLSVDPLLSNPGGRKAKGFRLRPDSPLVGAGLDLAAQFGIDPGPRDFFGNPLPPAGGQYAIGCDQGLSDPPRPGSTPPAGERVAGDAPDADVFLAMALDGLRPRDLESRDGQPFCFGWDW